MTEAGTNDSRTAENTAGNTAETNTTEKSTPPPETETPQTTPPPETATPETETPENHVAAAGIEVDEGVDAGNEATSDYAESVIASSTASLSVRLNEYMLENGRRYHTYYGHDKNILPADEIEQDRMDIHHEIMYQVMEEQLYLAPLTKRDRVLDVGTGTGIWCIDFADAHPEAEVIGTDLSPIQPRYIPPNCRFEVDDMELDWTYRRNYFDFIHARNVSQGITDFPRLVRQMYDHTAPGGWVELADLAFTVHSEDGTLAPDVARYFELLDKAMRLAGRPGYTGRELERFLKDGGFTDVTVVGYKQPMGPWPKKLNLKTAGKLALASNETAFHAYGLAVFTRVLKMSVEEAQEICTKAVAQSLDRRFHMYTPFHVVYGRKPEEGEGESA